MADDSSTLGHMFDVNTNPIRVDNLEMSVDILEDLLEDVVMALTHIVAKEQIRQISFIQQQELMNMKLKLTDLAIKVTELEDEIYK